MSTRAQIVSDTIVMTVDTIGLSDGEQLTGIVTQNVNNSTKKTKGTWKPSPQKATLLAFIPGAGQIYNRKYWKLPIVYGAFTGCAYAIRWNNMMFKDYKQAYKDITDDDPNTASYNQFLHLGTEVTEENIERYKELFRKRKDYYRRYRDLSVIITVAVYALSIIDAYVDASLSDFDISKDISLNIAPTIINDTPLNGINHTTFPFIPSTAKALGIACIINF